MAAIGVVKEQQADGEGVQSARPSLREMLYPSTGILDQRPQVAAGGFAWRRDAEEGWGAPQRAPPV